jgi:hypothetical protein
VGRHVEHGDLQLVNAGPTATAGGDPAALDQFRRWVGSCRRSIFASCFVPLVLPLAFAT